MTEPMGGGKVAMGIVTVLSLAIAVVMAVMNLASNGDTAEGDSPGDDYPVQVRSGLDDYSWDELSQISALISRAGDTPNAIRVASDFGLCSGAGVIDGSQTKTVELSDGSTARVCIVGFNHDGKVGGETAGITFQFLDCVGLHAMNSVDTNSGGWRGSDMRSWMNDELLSSLPSELSDVIVPVEKMTNNSGEARGTEAVSSSSDKLWLPSAVELAGYIDWGGEKYAYADDIDNSEGSAYRLCTIFGIDRYGHNEILAKTLGAQGQACEWWTRTSRPRYGDEFVYVDQYGNLHNYASASRSLGVAPGFCI